MGDRKNATNIWLANPAQLAEALRRRPRLFEIEELFIITWVGSVSLSCGAGGLMGVWIFGVPGTRRRCHTKVAAESQFSRGTAPIFVTGKSLPKHGLAIRAVQLDRDVSGARQPEIAGRGKYF